MVLDSVSGGVRHGLWPATLPSADNPPVKFRARIMIRDTQQSVAAVVWPWRDREESTAAATAAKRRHRVLVQATVGLSAGALMLLLHWSRMSTIAVCVAAAIFAMGHLVPRLYDALDSGIMLAAQALGQCLAWMLLAPFFYLCFLPGRLILMARRRDPLSRQWPSEQATFWVTRSARRPDHFTRQY